MSARGPAYALVFVVTAVILQTTLFVRIRPFGVAPDLILLVILATARHLAPEPTVMVGFTGGILSDLLGSTPLGLRALTLTVVAFLALRLRERLESNIFATMLGVALLTFAGEALLAVIGTLFGRGMLSDALVVRKLVLTSVYNLLLAAAVFPAVGLVLEPQPKRWAA